MYTSTEFSTAFNLKSQPLSKSTLIKVLKEKDR